MKIVKPKPAPTSILAINDERLFVGQIDAPPRVETSSEPGSFAITYDLFGDLPTRFVNVGPVGDPA